jgi:RNA polymerase sigma-70 factor (ECF subfamily)
MAPVDEAHVWRLRDPMGGQGREPRNRVETWANAARQGDSLALAKLLAAHYPRLRARAQAGMDAATKARVGPDDILQEVYLDVIRRIDYFEEHGQGSFLNWVLTILDHKLVDAWRVAHCQARDIDREVTVAAGNGVSSYWDLLDHLYADSGTPSRVIRREEAFSALLTCITDLSETHRQVIRLRFLNGLSVDQVAARLGKSKAAVVALTKRALEALRAAMDQLGEFTQGA